MKSLLFSLFAGLAVSACAPEAVLTPDSDAHQTVVMWHAYRGDEALALEAVIEAYNRSTSAHQVRLVSLPYDAMTNKLRVAIPRGNGPDNSLV